jgi:hypothetical protein
MARPPWRAYHAAGHLERLLEQIVQEGEVRYVRAGLGGHVMTAAPVDRAAASLVAALDRPGRPSAPGIPTSPRS